MDINLLAHFLFFSNNQSASHLPQMAASHVHKYDTGNVSTRPRHESCISMAETVCEGILEKKTATSWKLSRWQPRYFVLTRKSYTDGSNRYCLDYFQDKDTATRSREQLHEIWMSQKRDSADGKKSTHERFIFASVDLCGLRRVKKRYDESVSTRPGTTERSGRCGGRDKP